MKTMGNEQEHAQWTEFVVGARQAIAESTQVADHPKSTKNHLIGALNTLISRMGRVLKAAERIADARQRHEHVYNKELGYTQEQITRLEERSRVWQAAFHAALGVRYDSHLAALVDVDK